MIRLVAAHTRLCPERERAVEGCPRRELDDVARLRGVDGRLQVAARGDANRRGRAGARHEQGESEAQPDWKTCASIGRSCCVVGTVRLKGKLAASGVFNRKQACSGTYQTWLSYRDASSDSAVLQNLHTVRKLPAKCSVSEVRPSFVSQHNR